MNKITLINADVLTGLATLPDESVQCVVTSPPYWGLRDYQIKPVVWGGEEGCLHVWKENRRPWDNRAGALLRDEGTADFSGKKYANRSVLESFCRLCGAWKGSYGLEPTIELYVEHTVQIFREVRRVMRPDATLWLNLGDSFSSGGRKYYDSDDKLNARGHKERPCSGLKPKDLCSIPWRVALALQADGWWLRSDIIWFKPNPMPESCTDRPTKSHEYIFLLTKSANYFWDQEAVRENGVASLKSPGKNSREFQDRDPKHPDMRKVKMPDGWATHGGGHGSIHRNGREQGGPGEIRHGRNLRTVWEMATAPFPEAHFATFPPSLPERCIKAGTSEKGCCPNCGAPWKRVVEKKKAPKEVYTKTMKPESVSAVGDHTVGFGQKYQNWLNENPPTTTGWTPTCKCGLAETVPCTVLDPFLGAGTTALVAAKLGRDAIGIELNPEYIEMSRKRIAGEMGMLAEVEVK